MKKEYEELYGQMKAPAEWKADIKQQMHAALEAEKKEAAYQEEMPKEQNVVRSAKWSKARYAYTIGGFAAAAAVVLVLVNGGFLSNNRYESDAIIEDDAPMLGNTDSQIGGGDFSVQDSKADQIIFVESGTITIHKEDGAHLPEEMTEDMSKGEIEGVDVIIRTQTDAKEACYQAMFVIKDVTYTVSSEAVSKDAFDQQLSEFIQAELK